MGAELWAPQSHIDWWAVVFVGPTTSSMVSDTVLRCQV
jgi:hypothetical protein